MAIKSTPLAETATTIYQSDGDSIVTSMYFCNTSAGTLKFNINLVPKNSMPSDDNLIYYAVQIAPNDTYVIDTEKIMLEDGDYISASASLEMFVKATVSSMRY